LSITPGSGIFAKKDYDMVELNEADLKEIERKKQIKRIFWMGMASGIVATIVVLFVVTVLIMNW